MVLLLVVGLVVLAIAPSASAAKPFTTDTYEIVDNEFPVGECEDGSAILEDSTIQLTDRLYFDKDGDLTRIRVHGAIVEGRVYNETSGNELPVFGHFNFTIYPEDGVLVQTGLTARVNVPGAGHVLLDAGRFILQFEPFEVLWEAGPHQHLNGEVDELCEALK